MYVRRDRKTKARVVSLAVIIVLGLTCVLQWGTQDQQLQTKGANRRLLQDNSNEGDDDDNDDRRDDRDDDDDGPFPVSALNCTPRSIDQFPPDFLTPEQRAQGGVTFHILLSIYIFCALAIVCDDYFVSSLERICEVLDIQADVAGATFMAAGSSAPELFTSIIGVFLAKSDVGVGTIVGSAVFNILFIIALCGLGAGMVIYLTWWPMFRDCVYYMLSVIVLVLVIYDEQVHWYEALIMFLLYIVYIVLMYFNQPLGDYFVHRWAEFRRTNTCCVRTSDVAKTGDYKDERSRLLGDEDDVGDLFSRAQLTESTRSDRSNKNVQRQLSQGGLKRERKSSRISRTESFTKTAADDIDYKISSVDFSGLEEYESPLSVPESIPGRIWWGLMLPVSLLYMLSIPDCRRPGCWNRLFIATFIMSIVWIAGLSYVMVWMVTIAGDTLGIPDTVMGLTILAAGTSIPDALSSLFVARDGYGDMAVSNSIGSNIFDILLCLGLPWLLQTAAVSPGSVLVINSSSLTFVSLTLLATVVFLFASMLVNGWKLDKKFGVLCLMVYAVVITVACLFEMNVFGGINLPACPRVMS